MSTEDDQGDDAFFSRWSRRKRQAALKPDADAPASPSPPTSAPLAKLSVGAPTDASPDTPTSETAPVKNGDRDPKRPFSEEDFKDVDFTKLDYQSDYDRFMQSGVPETVRQKALTQLWHSDTIFTQVDPFQDYAGDFTDAAVAVPNGMLKTAYRVGQGFLSDDEARTWDALDKAEIKPEIAALPVLGPGYRVRSAMLADAAALAALQSAAIRATAGEAYGPETAERWATSRSAADFVTSLGDTRTATLVAINDDTGAIAAFIAREDRDIAALYVAPGQLRRGLARRLIERLIATIETPEARGELTVDASHVSRPIFARLGFRPIVVMTKELPDGASLSLTTMRRPIVSNATFALAPETPDQADVRALFADAEAYMAALYPAESNHMIDVAALLEPGVVFLVARLDGAAVGCGALVPDAQDKTAGATTQHTGELKRMWVSEACRGLKMGARVLDGLIGHARDLGFDVVRLETGIYQPEAIALYRRAGFVEIDAFGPYARDPLSLFMELRLTHEPPPTT